MKVLPIVLLVTQIYGSPSHMIERINSPVVINTNMDPLLPKWKYLPNDQILFVSASQAGSGQFLLDDDTPATEGTEATAETATTDAPETTFPTTNEPETTKDVESTTYEPETTTYEPETTTNEPETTTNEPETTTNELETTTNEPETSGNPVTTTPDAESSSVPTDPPEQPTTSKPSNSSAVSLNLVLLIICLSNFIS